MTIRHEELSARQRECHQKLQCLPKEEQLLLAALQKALLSNQVRAQSLKTVRQGKRKLDSSPDSPANQGVLGDCHHLAKKKTIALQVSACRESFSTSNSVGAVFKPPSINPKPLNGSSSKVIVKLGLVCAPSSTAVPDVIVA